MRLPWDHAGTSQNLSGNVGCRPPVHHHTHPADSGCPPSPAWVYRLKVRPCFLPGSSCPSLPPGSWSPIQTFGHFLPTTRSQLSSNQTIHFAFRGPCCRPHCPTGSCSRISSRPPSLQYPPRAYICAGARACARTRTRTHTCTHTGPSNQKSFTFKRNNRNFSCWLTITSVNICLGELSQKLHSIGLLAKCSWDKMRKQQVESVH